MDVAIMNKFSAVRSGLGKMNSSVWFNLARRYHGNGGPLGVVRMTLREALLRVALERSTPLSLQVGIGPQVLPMAAWTEEIPYSATFHYPLVHGDGFTGGICSVWAPFNNESSIDVFDNENLLMNTMEMEKTIATTITGYGGMRGPN